MQETVNRKPPEGNFADTQWVPLSRELCTSNLVEYISSQYQLSTIALSPTVTTVHFPSRPSSVHL